MPQARRRHSWRCAASAAALLALAQPAVAATKSAAVKNADHYLATGNLRAAEIELRNAIRQSPQDPLLRARLARIYLALGDPISAEREARAARERNGAEADYLAVLADALLRQGKFADLSDLSTQRSEDSAMLRNGSVLPLFVAVSPAFNQDRGNEACSGG